MPPIYGKIGIRESAGEAEMVKQIIKDVFFLSQKAEPATKDDIQTAQDLLDTLREHESECVGMAANMIGVRKRIIVVNVETMNIAMLNPVIIKRSGAYETEEGCLSLSDTRSITRYHDIEVKYQDMELRKHRQKYSGWTAQIIQHECDHLEGILI